MFTTKIYEVLKCKGMDTDIYARTDELEEKIRNISIELNGTRDGKKWILGKKDCLSDLFSELKRLPFSEKETRDAIKVEIGNLKSDIANLYDELKSLRSQQNELLVGK